MYARWTGISMTHWIDHLAKKRSIVWGHANPARDEPSYRTNSRGTRRCVDDMNLSNIHRRAYQPAFIAQMAQQTPPGKTSLTSSILFLFPYVCVRLPLVLEGYASRERSPIAHATAARTLYLINIRD